MTSLPPLADSSAELQPHLLYRAPADQAEFATWRLESGQEALATFSTAAAAETYRGSLADPRTWNIYSPPRDKLVTILESSLQAGIRIAALDPASGGARTLFDLGQVVQAAQKQVES